jgi:hypothetical protein
VEVDRAARNRSPCWLGVEAHRTRTALTHDKSHVPQHAYRKVPKEGMRDMTGEKLFKPRHPKTVPFLLTTRSRSAALSNLPSSEHPDVPTVSFTDPL